MHPVSPETQESNDLLIIDDNPAEIRLIEEVVETADIETTLYTAFEKEKAFELLQQRGEYSDIPQPDAVLLDWNLTEGTGRGILEKIRNDLPQTEVAIITSSEPQKEKIQTEAPEADKYFTKPSDPEEYIGIIDSLFS